MVPLLLTAAASYAATYDPDLKWRTISTEHFDIHFHQGVEQVADEFSQTVEPIYDEMTAEVAQILHDLARAQSLTLRVPELRAAALFVTVWSSAAEQAVMDGLDQAGLRSRIGEALASVADLVIDPQPAASRA